MRKASPVGLTPDGRELIVVTDDGEYLAVAADARLRAAIRGDRPRLGQLEIQMESALTPRQIQARLRSGESLDEVARAAGVPAEQISPFAGPVLAERAHLADLARGCQVRRRGESSAHRSLEEAVREQLTNRGIDPDVVEWDSWRREDRLWTVRAGYRSGSAAHEALFTFDQRSRFSTAANEDARWLIGDETVSRGTQPGKRRRNPDEEPTVDLHDELALVRAVQEDESGAQPPAAQSVVAPIEPAELVDVDPDDYMPAELTEVDGLYDIVPGPRSDMDVLYEMLSSFNGDSVSAYAGLTNPVAPDEPGDEEESGALPAEPIQDSLPAAQDEPGTDVAIEEEEPPARPEAAAVKTPPSTAAPQPDKAPADSPTADQGSSAKPAPGSASAASAPTVRKRKRTRSGGRAAVPSWDEIMFGAPKPHAD